MSFDLKSLVAARMGENYDLHSRYLNPTLVEILRITGFDKVYARAEMMYTSGRQAVHEGRPGIGESGPG